MVDKSRILQEATVVCKKTENICAKYTVLLKREDVKATTAVKCKRKSLGACANVIRNHTKSIISIT